VTAQEASFARRESGFVGGIPVRNIWLLMLYASDLLRTLGSEKTSLERNPDDIPDLVAELLARLVEKRLRRNLSFGYRERDAVLGRVRGRVLMLETECGRLLSCGKVACRFDELTVDTLRNRYVRSALDSIARLVRKR
jgi:5-methylcytosine-specific restriction enzyme subunit McrC